MNNFLSSNTSRWLALALCCCLGATASAQNRAGGGGGGGGFGGGGSRGGGGGGSTSTATSAGTHDYSSSTATGEVSMTYDTDAHSIVAITDQETAARLRDVIKKLDRPKPQVLIKVVFLEVTYNNGSDIGFEGGITKRLDVSQNLSASNLFGLAAQNITPTQGVTTLPGAGLYTVVGNDFSATLRAIAEAGKVEVLSRPTILARNNQQASILVGQEVPLVTGVSYDTFGNQHIAITYQQVGIQLQVTPFITPDNMVEMILAPSISAVDPTLSQPIAYATNGTAISAPYLDIRSANTVVVTPDGQTVIIGGLMQNSKSSTDSKIPILGDIPLLGALFRHKVAANSKTELLMFLTPYVVKSPADLVNMSIDERTRAEIPKKAFSEQELNQFLDSLPASSSPASSSPSLRGK